MAGVRHFLQEAVNTMREAVLILKLVCIMERNLLPGYVLEHLNLTREFIQRTMNEACAALSTGSPPYSGPA
jgi:hypothetical protein